MLRKREIPSCDLLVAPDRGMTRVQSGHERTYKSSEEINRALRSTLLHLEGAQTASPAYASVKSIPSRAIRSMFGVGIRPCGLLAGN